MFNIQSMKISLWSRPAVQLIPILYHVLFKNMYSCDWEHSENKIITYFESEVGPPGGLQLSIEQTLLPLAFLQRSCLLNAGLEHSRCDLVFEQPR